MATDGDNTSFIYDIEGQHLYNGVLYLAKQPRDLLQKIPDLELSAEDIIVVSYPKSGATWMCELVDAVQHDGDIQKAAQTPSNQHWLMLETAVPGWFNGLDTVQANISPRLIKTHVDVTFLARQVREQGVKTIVTMRNPKDCLVSFYHFYRMNGYYHNFPGTWEEFFKMFQAGQLNYGDPIDHMLGWWTMNDLPNVKVFMYEDMLRDRPAAVRRLSQFLGKQFTDVQMGEIVRYTSFASMGKLPKTNPRHSRAFKHKTPRFYRKREVGDWKNHFTEEQNEYMDELLEMKIRGTGLTFTFE